MILLKDGVKYFPYVYADEKELEDMIIEHYKDIFGPNSLYFDSQTMKTETGIEAKNDGLVLAIDQNKWYIIEVELAKHPLHEHIIPQITKFSIAYEEESTKKKIVKTLDSAIQQDPFKKAITQIQKVDEPYKTLTDIIDMQPTIAIIIDQEKVELDQICKKLPFTTQTTVFKTYTRENIDKRVHIHEFEPFSTDEFDASYDSKEKGFVCLVSKKHYDTIYDTVEIVEHLRDEHGIDPDDQHIDGWEERDQRLWEKSRESEKPSRRTREEPEESEIKMPVFKQQKVITGEEGPKKLVQVLEVAELVFKGQELSNAFKSVAKQHGVHESTVRDKCTRQLNIDTKQFRELIQDKNSLIAFLKEKYPQYENLINEKLR